MLLSSVVWVRSGTLTAYVARNTMSSQEPLNQQCGFHVKKSADVDGGAGDGRKAGMCGLQEPHQLHQIQPLRQAHQFPVQQSALSFGSQTTEASPDREKMGVSASSKSALSATMPIPPSSASKLYRTPGHTKAWLAPSSMSPGLAVSQGDMALAEHSHLTPGVKKMMRSVVRGLKAYQEPEAATEGLGGTYFFKSETGGKIAIMKPCDEEPMAPNNPKGFRGRKLGEPGLKPTVRVGEAASREVAAYLLDHNGAAGVPHTVMVRMSHPIFHYGNHMEECGGMGEAVGLADPAVDARDGLGASDNEDAELPLKHGSLQSFVRHECDTTEMGPKLFNKKDIHRIGILDVRLFNTDRHGGNILVQKVQQESGVLSVPAGGFHHHSTQYRLVPIDHGFALPEGLEPPYFEWQHWPQAMMPFSQEELQYIASLDAEADIELLRRELPDIKEASFRVLELSTLLLKKAAAAGLTLSEIAGVLTRPICIDEEPSELEKMCFEIRREMHLEEMEDTRRLQSVHEAASHLSSMTMEDVEDPEVMDQFAAGDAVCGDREVNLARGGASPDSESALSSSFVMNPEEGAGHDDQPTPQLLTRSLARNQTESDALFSMDEDGGSKTPQPGSPMAQNMTTRTKDGMYIEAPTLRVKSTGEVEHLSTPFGTTFKSVLGGTASSSPSYDSETHRGDSDNAPEDDAVSSLDSGFELPFRGAQSYVPRLTKMPAVGMTAVKDRKQTGGLRVFRVDDVSLSSDVAAEEPRGCYDPSFVLKDMDERAWAVFMSKAEAKMAGKLASGAWVDTFFGSVAQMSCPV